jgi:hypothetical protein
VQSRPSIEKEIASDFWCAQIPSLEAEIENGCKLVHIYLPHRW